MPRPCSLCHSAKRSIIDASILSGWSLDKVAARHSIPRSSVASHKKHVMAARASTARVVETQAARASAPEMPVLPANASSRDRMAAHCIWLQERINHAQKSGAPMKELSMLAGQYTQANRLLARLSGALDITEAQVLRSVPWARIMATARSALSKHPAALSDFVQALAALEEGS